MNEEKSLTVREDVLAELDVADVKKQVGKIQELMGAVMKRDEHYGAIPGTDGKPTLFKAGAEKLGLTFRLAAFFEITRYDLADDHREYEVVCTLKHQLTEKIVAQGVGNCTTREKKYRYRIAARTCPECGVAAIIKGKEEYGGGWVCFKKKDGCGTTYADNDHRIVSQPTGRVENPDIADCYNTVLKVAKKRAHVDATITACAASDIFNQDLEDLGPEERNGHATPPQRSAEPPRQAAPRPVNPPRTNGNGPPPPSGIEAERRKVYPKLEGFDDVQKEVLVRSLGKARTYEGITLIARLVDTLVDPAFASDDRNQALTVLSNAKLADLKKLVVDFEERAAIFEVGVSAAFDGPGGNEI